MNSILDAVPNRAKTASIRCGHPYHPAAPRPEPAAKSLAYGSRRIRTALQLIVASTVIALSTPAAAITPQQCDAIKTSFIKSMQYQMKVLDQGKILLQQKPILMAITISLKMNHPDLKETDFEDIKQVGERVNNAAFALDNGDDLGVHDQAARAIHDLCP